MNSNACTPIYLRQAPEVTRFCPKTVPVACKQSFEMTRRLLTCIARRANVIDTPNPLHPPIWEFLLPLAVKVQGLG